MMEGLKITLAFPSWVEDTVPVCLVQDTDGIASARPTSETCYFDDIDQDRGSGDIIGCDAVWLFR